MPQPQAVSPYRNHWGLPPAPQPTVVPAALRAALGTWFESRLPVLLVQAPAGWGKSTALSAWVRDSVTDTPVVWIGGSALVQTWQDVQDALLASLDDLGLNPLGSELFVALNRLPHEVLIVIDDAHRILASDGFPLLEREAKRFPMLRWIAVTAQLPTLPRGSLLRRAVIGPSELAWSAGDAHAVAGDTLRAEVDDVVRLAAGQPAAVLDYLNETSVTSLSQWRHDWLLSRAESAGDPARMRSTLRVLAQFLYVPVDSLHLLGVAGAAESVRSLVAAGLAEYDERSGAGSVVRLARSDRLALEADASGPTLQWTAMHSAAADAFLAAGALAPAILHLVRAHRVPEAVALLLDSGVDELRHWHRAGSLRDLCDAILAIPLDQLAVELEAHAVAVLILHSLPFPAESRGTALEARFLAMRKRDLEGLPTVSRVLVTAAASTVLVARGRTAEARAFGAALSQATVAIPWTELQLLGMAPPALWLIQAHAELAEGWVSSAWSLASTALDAVQGTGNPTDVRKAETIIALCAVMSGDAATAVEYIARAERGVHDEASWRASAYGNMLALAKTVLGFGSLDVAAILRAQESFAGDVESSGGWYVGKTVGSSYAKLFSGETLLALAEIRELAQIPHRQIPTLLRALVGAAHADALNCLGRSGAAAAVIRESPELPGHVVCQAARSATAALTAGDPRLAIRETEACVAFASRHPRHSLIFVLLRRAIAQEALGMSEAADATFSDAIAHHLSRPEASSFFLIRDGQLDALWARLERSHPEVATAARSVELQESPGAGPAPTVTALSSREIDVMRQLRTDATIVEIGQRLFLSRNTVKSHLRSLYRKLGASNRLEALDIADRLGIGNSEHMP